MMAGKLSLRIVFWLAAVMCGAAPSAQGQPTAHIGFEGNWSVEWTDVDYDETPTSVRISLFKSLNEECWDGPSDVRMQGCTFEKTIEQGAEWNIEIEFPGDQWDRVQALKIDPDTGTLAIHHYFGIFERWGGNEVARLVTPDRIEGVWSTSDTQGRTFWQRIIPEITRVELFDGDQRGNFVAFDNLGPRHISVHANWIEEYWGDSSFLGSRPVFGVRVLGSDFWGRHTAALPNSTGFQVGGVSLETSPTNSDLLTFTVRLWPGVQPGRHVLLLDGREILIDLEIENFPVKLTRIAIPPLTFTGLGTPNSFSIAKLAFHGLAGKNGTKVAALSFTGLGTLDGIMIDMLVFSGLNGANGTEIGPLQFTGMGELEPVTVSDELVFVGWGGGLEGQTTEQISFVGWGGGLEDQKTEPVSFEGWGGGPNLVLAEALEFRGLGLGLSYTCNGVAMQTGLLEMPSRQSNGQIFAHLRCPVTWRAAEQNCRGLGGYLVTLATEAEASFVAGMVAGCSGSGCWIGATDMAVEGSFAWVTGEKWSFENWSRGEPNNYKCGEDFAHVYPNGEWNDYPSGEKFDRILGDGCGEFGEFATLEFICEFELGLSDANGDGSK